MNCEENIIELLKEIRDNQLKQIEATAKQRSLYIRVIVATLVLFAILYGPYYLQLLR